MLETQLAQLAVAVLSFEQGKSHGKLKDPVEASNLVKSGNGIYLYTFVIDLFINTNIDTIFYSLCPKL